MLRQKSFSEACPTLYLVGTPIGNLQELTPRAIETLKSVDMIACEDTRVTMKLLSSFNIHTPLISHHAHNQDQSVLKIVDLLLEGKSIALVSDAGTPLISDPGNLLVNAAIKAGIPVVPITGSCALISALIASNIVTHPFYFHGFLPSTNKQLRKVLMELKHFPHTMIFYLSVHKYHQALQEMKLVFGDRHICLARELTKKHEEFIRGTISEIIEIGDELRGEFVCVVSGNDFEKEPALDESSIFERVVNQMNKGYSASSAIKTVADELNISKNEVYRIYHQGCGTC